MTLRHKSCIVWGVLLLICFTACNKSEVYYNYREIKNTKWSKLDTLFFDIDSLTIIPGEPYTISLEVTHSLNYPYRNIWIYLHEDMINPNFTVHGKQFMLADEFGKWHGAGFGSLYQISLKYFDNVQFKDKRNYRIKVVHGMRDEPLEGIEKVGLKISKIEKQDN